MMLRLIWAANSLGLHICAVERQGKADHRSGLYPAQKGTKTLFPLRT